MAKLNSKSQDKLSNTLNSLVKLKNLLEENGFEIDEGEIAWLDTDIQHLKLVLEEMEKDYYA